jgi:hypothetical protein
MNETNKGAPQAAGTTDGKALWGEAKDAVAQVAESASEKLKGAIDSQKEKAAERVGEVASALRETGEGLRDVGPLPDLADQAAEQIEKLATYVQSKNLGDLVREVERFARREPAIFLGASFAVGLLGGRFMKATSSSSAQPQGSSSGGSRGQKRHRGRDIEVRPAKAMRTAVGSEVEITMEGEENGSKRSKAQNGRANGNHAAAGK